MVLNACLETAANEQTMTSRLFCVQNVNHFRDLCKKKLFWHYICFLQIPQYSEIFNIGLCKCYSMFNALCWPFCPKMEGNSPLHLSNHMLLIPEFKLIILQYIFSGSIQCYVFYSSVECRNNSLTSGKVFSHSPDLGVAWLLHCQIWYP